MTEDEVDSSRIGDYDNIRKAGGVAERDSGRDDCYDSLAATHKGKKYIYMYKPDEPWLMTCDSDGHVIKREKLPPDYRGEVNIGVFEIK